MKPIRLILVEDHELMSAGMRALLQDINDIEVVAEGRNGEEALQLIEQHQPDVVSMDIAMKGMNGLEVTEQIGKRFPKVRVIILSMHVSEEYVLHALRVGAAGYLLKDAEIGEFQRAIRTVASGETYLSADVSKHVVADYMRRASKDVNPFESLTSRQQEILKLVAQSQTTQEIADSLFISPKTVETHRSLLMKRLNIKDKAGLVRFAIRMGVVSPDA